MVKTNAPSLGQAGQRDVALLNNTTITDGGQEDCRRRQKGEVQDNGYSRD